MSSTPFLKATETPSKKSELASRPSRSSTPSRFDSFSFYPSNVDGAGNFFDLLGFLELFDAGDLSTDLNGDGSLNTDDVELMIRITRG
ncbi:MAG: hypothetical protein AAGI53_07235 [Planctomycetota bacterium]